VIGNAILEHREVIAGQTADVLAGSVSHRDGERYHVDTALEGGALRGHVRRARNGKSDDDGEDRENPT
jgi:hypothetical protein